MRKGDHQADAGVTETGGVTMSGVGGVRDYDRIRRFLGHIYLYGFFSREDFSQAGIGSAKDYDYGVKLIRSIFPESADAAVWQAGRKHLRIRREYARSGESRMTDSYLLHALDEDEDLPELLHLLADISKGPKTLDELCKLAELRSEDETSKYSTTRRRVLDLTEYGYLQKKGKRFSLAPDPFSQLNDQALLLLHSYICFAGGVSYPRVAGSFLRRTLERELLRRGRSFAQTPPLLLRHNVNANVFDEELVYQLLALMHERRFAFIKLDDKEICVLPVALRIDTRLGRWYLLAEEDQKPSILRISTVRSVRAGKTVDVAQWKARAEQVRNTFVHSGCSGNIPAEGPVLVEARLHFTHTPGMRSQFLRELRFGEVSVREDGEEYYQAWVNDPKELVPFLRSFAPWLQVLPGQHNLAEKLRSDLMQMRQAAHEETQT